VNIRISFTSPETRWIVLPRLSIVICRNFYASNVFLNLRDVVSCQSKCVCVSEASPIALMVELRLLPRDR